MKVKGGGVLTPRGFLFELTGGALCLDLANTLDNRPTPRPKELLASYADLVSWAEQAGAVSRGEAAQLRRRATRRRREALAALRRALSLRETLFAVFSAAATGRAVPDDALSQLNRPLSEALSRQRVLPSARGYGWGWVEDERALDRMLWPVLRSAADLLTSGDLERVRECASQSCAWLFLDRSRNGSRRWCDMSVCGNRAKARRHYQRRKARARPERGS